MVRQNPKHRTNAQGLSYKRELRLLQIELVKLQKHFIGCRDRILVVVEGRDAAGKDGVIKRIVQHLSPRETRVVALGIPSDRDASTWYFQRYAPHLPAAGEFVLFNRSWYNRAGVERVMGFCTDDEYREFIASVPEFEKMLVNSGIKLLKYYLDISKGEQRARLRKRRKDPLTQWKTSPIDDKAVELWKHYSRARNEMLKQTHTTHAPWFVVHTDDKRKARINLIKHLLHTLHYGNKDMTLLNADSKVVFPFDVSRLKRGGIAA